MSPCTCSCDRADDEYNAPCCCTNKKSKKSPSNIICTHCANKKKVSCKICELNANIKNKKALDKQQSNSSKCGKDISKEQKCNLCGEDFGKHVKIKVLSQVNCKVGKSKAAPAPCYSNISKNTKEICEICGKKLTTKTIKCCEKKQSSCNACCREESPGKRVKTSPSQFQSQTSCCLFMTHKEEGVRDKFGKSSWPSCQICGKGYQDSGKKCLKNDESRCDICGVDVTEESKCKLCSKYNQNDQKCSICGRDFLKESKSFGECDLEEQKCMICGKEVLRICNHCGKDALLADLPRCTFCGKDYSNTKMTKCRMITE